MLDLDLVAAASLLGVAPEDLPAIPGFAESAFSPLVDEVVRRCLGEEDATGILGVAGAETGLVLGTGFGDVVTHDLASERLARGRPPNPLLFYQAVPTSVLGHVCSRYGITGPVQCLSLNGDFAPQLLATADAVLATEDVRQILVVAVELGPTPRTLAVSERRSTVVLPESDAAVALLVRPGGPLDVPLPDPDDGFGRLSALAQLCEGRERAATA